MTQELARRLWDTSMLCLCSFKGGRHSQLMSLTPIYKVLMGSLHKEIL